jgi:hypothetical protein
MTRGGKDVVVVVVVVTTVVWVVGTNERCPIVPELSIPVPLVFCIPAFPLLKRDFVVKMYFISRQGDC